MERYTKKNVGAGQFLETTPPGWNGSRIASFLTAFSAKNCETSDEAPSCRQGRPSYSCDYCGNHVHPTADTIFHKSHKTPLTNVVLCDLPYVLHSLRHLSQPGDRRETGVTYKTAWRMFKQIHLQCSTGQYFGPIGGNGYKSVEVDEMYHGSRSEGNARTRNRSRLRSWAWSSARDKFAPSSPPMLSPTLCADSSKSTSCRARWYLPMTFQFLQRTRGARLHASADQPHREGLR